MSFSSTLSRSPRNKNRHALSLSEALYQLGFQPASTQSYDWMTAYPDAIPLLEAIRTSLDPSSVLSESEAENLKRLTLIHKAVSPGHVIDAAQPLVNAPSVKDLASTREALLTSARNRVKLLRIQRDVLRETLRQERHESASPESSLENEDAHMTTHATKASQLLSTAEELKQYSRENPDILRNDLEVLRSCDVEAKHCETVASVLTQGFPRDLKNTYNHQANITSRTKQAINAYAKLKRMQCMYRALVIRDAAMIASLGTHDGRYLEMTTSSMLSLIKELRSNAAKAMEVKASHVSEEARESLRNDINLFHLSERASQQDAYIDAMRQCISLYLEQRLRIHCLQTLASRVTTRRDRILKMLRAIAPDVSSLMITGNNIRSEPAIAQGRHEETELSWSPCGTEEAKECEICKKDKFSLEDLENKVFSAHIESVASQISSTTRNTGESSSWLNLSSHPQYDVLIKELEEQLGKNTMVLEALLQKKASIVDKASSSNQSQSPSRSWISRINDESHSPKLSSHSSYSSR